MKYNLFPKLDFFSYMKKLHVSYHPGRPKTEVARRLIMRMTSEGVKKKYPQMETSWELLGYDAPASVEVEFVNGQRKKFMAEHFSRYEMQGIVDRWQYESHLEYMKQNNLEKPDDDD
jgi:hypothetical protein